MLLISLSLLELKNIKSSIFSSILSLIFYPPIIIFIAPIWLAYLIKNFKNPKIYKAILIIIPILLIIIWYILGLATNNFNLGSVFQTFLNYIIRPELDNGIPNFMIWNIIPLILLPFILLGLIKIIKNKIYYFFAPITIGLIFWFIYLSTWKVIIIEYARVVAVTSILLVIVSGFGIDWILKLFQRKYPGFFKKNVIYILKSIVILLIIFMSFSYTSHKNWLKLTIKLNPPESHRTGSPAAPVNKYLTSDDLKLFNNIHQERFVSLPWKGLVIGAATNNFPLDSKPSTITNKILSYDVFMSTDCRGKDSLSIKYNIDFAYTKPFNCSNFKPVGYSNEGMFLYEFKQNN